MRSKKVAILLIINIVFALSIIGLAFGLVLVAQQATLNNNMSIRYEAKNVDVEIVASGKKYASKSDTTGEAIKLADSEETSITIQFTAEQDSDETNTNISFETVSIDDATGRAVYTFRIKNTASINNTNELKALATFSGLTEDDNVSVFVGPGEAYADTEITSDTDDYFINIGAGQSSRSLVVVLKITDATESVQDFVLNMDLQLGYDITDPDAFDWSGATTTNDLDIIWGFRNRSGADFNITVYEPMDNVFFENQLSHNTDYVNSHIVPSNCLQFMVSTTNTTDNFLFSATMMLLDGTILHSSSGIFQANEQNYDGTLGTFDGNPYSAIMKNSVGWGMGFCEFQYCGGWYDTDIKIYIEITPYN